LDLLAGASTLYAFDFDGTLARIVRDHQDARIVAVRIGKKNTSAARFYLKRQSEITELLRYLVKAHDRNGGPPSIWSSFPPTR